MLLIIVNGISREIISQSQYETTPHIQVAPTSSSSHLVMRLYIVHKDETGSYTVP